MNPNREVHISAPEHPLVTVITLCYNTNQRYLNTLNSIREQTYPNIELIIIDDASRDNSVEIIENWINTQQFNCTFIKHKENKGICAAANVGIKRATGEFITFIADDIMLPDKISNDVAFMMANPDAGMCHSNLIAVFEETGNEVVLKGKHSQNPFHDFFAWNIEILSPTVFYRKKVFDEVGLFDENLIFEDLDFLLRATYKFKLSYRDEITVRYIKGAKKATLGRVKEMTRQSLYIFRKWKFLKNYRYYLHRRHLSLFYSLSQDQKWASLRFIPASLRSFSDKRLYRAFMNLLFKW